MIRRLWRRLLCVLDRHDVAPLEWAARYRCAWCPATFDAAVVHQVDGWHHLAKLDGVVWTSVEPEDVALSGRSKRKARARSKHAWVRAWDVPPLPAPLVDAAAGSGIEPPRSLHATQLEARRDAVVELVEVDCPDCGNRNRQARRACRACGRTGKVTKSVPVENEGVAHG